jgi:hypothetical protein
MLNEKELHGHHGRTVRAAGAEGSEPTRMLQIGKRPSHHGPRSPA